MAPPASPARGAGHQETQTPAVRARQEGTITAAMEAAFSDFRNANTWWHHKQNGTESEFDARYEEAIEDVRERLLGREIPVMIDGEAVSVEGFVELRSPTDDRLVVCRAPRATQEQAARAVDAARAGFDAWRSTPWTARADMLDRAADLYQEHFYELCAIMSFELGKNRFETSIDVDEAIDFLRFYALQMRKCNGFEMKMGSPFPQEHCSSVLKPCGVFSVICPFNFPVAITTGMTAAALVTGNTAIMKPSMKGVLSGFRCYELLREAGIPGSALQFIVGPDRGVAVELTTNPKIDGIVFTGSKDVGFEVTRKFKERDPGKPVIAEMGGKNAIIVTAKADLEKAVEGCYRSAFGAQGQKCSAASRLLVHRSVMKEFLERLVERTRGTVVDLPWKKQTFLGPVVEERKYKEYQEVVKRLKKDGKVLAGGDVVTHGELGHGYYVTPVLATGLPRDHEYFHKEFFLPIVVAWEVEDLEDGVKAANAVEYGLTAGIFTEDPDEADYFFDHIEAGVCYLNRRMGGSTAAVVNGQSFGGWKHSGTTGRGAGGRWYLQQFLREQSQTRVVD